MNTKQYNNLKAPTKKIYQHLGDDISRRIFEYRLLFRLTGDFSFISRIVEMSPELWQNSKEQFAGFSGEKTVIYGAGQLGLHLLRLYKNEIN